MVNHHFRWLNPPVQDDMTDMTRKPVVHLFFEAVDPSHLRLGDDQRRMWHTQGIQSFSLQLGEPEAKIFFSGRLWEKCFGRNDGWGKMCGAQHGIKKITTREWFLGWNLNSLTFWEGQSWRQPPSKGDGLSLQKWDTCSLLKNQWFNGSLLR